MRDALYARPVAPTRAAGTCAPSAGDRGHAPAARPAAAAPPSGCERAVVRSHAPVARRATAAPFGGRCTIVLAQAAAARRAAARLRALVIGSAECSGHRMRPDDRPADRPNVAPMPAAASSRRVLDAAIVPRTHAGRLRPDDLPVRAQKMRPSGAFPPCQNPLFYNGCRAILPKSRRITRHPS